jgi:CDP-glycerol glycerophosphotransferase (TagB/SpsB family)
MQDRHEAAHVARIEALLTADDAARGRRHVFGAQASTAMSLVECFNVSHALVSDVSSVPADYLYSGKPFVITQVDDADPAAFVAEFALARGAYVARLREPGSLAGAVAGLALDTLGSVREEIRKYYLGDIPRETYARTFRDAVRTLVVEAGTSHLSSAGAHETAGAEDAVLEERAAAQVAEFVASLSMEDAMGE